MSAFAIGLPFASVSGGSTRVTAPSSYVPPNVAGGAGMALIATLFETAGIAER
jgi:hypothetical protein